MVVDNGVLDRGKYYGTHEDKYGNITDFEIAYGTTGWDRELNDSPFDEIPPAGKNRWHSYIWWDQKPEHPNSYGNYIYETGWDLSVTVLPTDNPNNNDDPIDYPTAITNPKPEDSKYGSVDLEISATIGGSYSVFSAGVGDTYTIEIKDPLDTTKDDTGTQYSEIVWDRWHPNKDVGWSDSLENAAGVRYTVKAGSLDPDVNYDAENESPYDRFDVTLEANGQLKYTYDTNGTRVYCETPTRTWYPGAEVTN